MNSLFSRLSLCRKQSRVQSYVDGDLDKDLINSDNEENIARKHERKLGIDCGNAAATRDEFMFPPSTGLWKMIADAQDKHFYLNFPWPA